MIRRLIMLYAFVYPFEGLWIELFESETILKPYRLVGMAALILLGLKSLLGRGSLRFDRFDLAFGTIIATGFGMALFWYMVRGTGSLSWAANETILLTFSFLMYLAIKQAIVTIEDGKKVFFAFVAGTIVSTVISQGFTAQVAYERVSGYFSNPNGLAISSAIGLIGIVAWALFEKTRQAATRYVIATVLCSYLAYMILNTGSRSPVLALAVGFLPLMALMAQRRGGKAFRVLAFGGIMLVVAAVMATIFMDAGEQTVVSRYSLDSASTQTGSGRLDIWRSAWAVAQDHYLLGAGVAQYRFYHQRYIEMLTMLYSRNLRSDVALGVHNDHLNLITCYGIPMFMLYLGTVASILRRLFRAAKERPEEASFLVPAILATVVLIVINQIGHNMMQGPAFFTVMALATGPCLSMYRRQVPQRAPRPILQPRRLGRLRA